MDFVLFADFGTSLLVGLATAAAGAAMSAAMAPKAGKQNTYGEISAGAVRADADTLGVRRELESAARLGIKSDIPSGTPKAVTETRKFVTVPASALTYQQRAEMGITQTGDVPVEIPYNEAEWRAGGRFNPSGRTQPNVFEKEVVVGYEPTTETVDFTGQGDADIEAAVAQQMAPMMLELEKEYGPEFIAQAKAMQEQADPEGTAARAKLAELIDEQAANKPERPLAELLDRQVGDALTAGSGMTAEEKAIADRVLTGQVADTTELEGIKQSLVSGSMGYQRQAGAQQAATGWLSSGATPEDVEYRRRQQTMANRANFLAGRTPTAQFGQLSGAQQGAAPVVFGPGLTSVNTDATGAFAQSAANQYQTQTGFAAQQANPWFAGLSTAIRGVGGVLAARRN